MIEFLVTLGILWIVLRVLAAFVALPFRLLGVLLNTPMGTIFWIFLVVMVILSMRRNNDVEGNGAYRMKDLFRSTTNRRVFGVCGGIAEYFDTNPTIVRLIFVAMTILGGGTMILAYLIAALIIPTGHYY